MLDKEMKREEARRRHEARMIRQQDEKRKRVFCVSKCKHVVSPVPTFANSPGGTRKTGTPHAVRVKAEARPWDFYRKSKKLLRELLR